MNRLFLLISSYMARWRFRKKGVHISPFAYVSADCAFEGEAYIDRFCVIHQSNIGKFSYIGNRSNISYCLIGRYCSIASDVKIGLGIHPINFVSTSPLFYSNKNVFRKKWTGENLKVTEYRQVIIGHDVWIGANAIVMGGVKIGNGAIIGAGAVVTKDVPPFSIVGGVPARIIKYRFSSDTIKKISKTKWWDYPENEIKIVSKYFADPLEFIDFLSKSRRGK